MAISSKELAERLGISASAVSLALNGHKGISDETRERILAEAEKHGIQRNRKVVQNSNRISLVIYKKRSLNFGDSPQFSDLLEGITTRATEQGYNLQIYYFQDQQDPQEQLHAIGLASCSGIILLATEMSDQDLEPFRHIRHPLVILDNCFVAEDISCVAMDNFQGAYLAARHLLEQGHRQLGHIESDLNFHHFQERRDGFLNAIKESGLQCSVQHIQIGSSPENGCENISKYLNTLGNKRLEITGLFADSDTMAVPCMQALQRHGYRIPEDISIIGFGNMPMAYAITPRLTTINVDVRRMGVYAVDCLIDNIRHGKASSRITLRVGATLVQQNSVKAL